MQKLKETNYISDLYSPRVFDEIIYFDSDAGKGPGFTEFDPCETAVDFVEETGITTAVPEIIAIMTTALVAGGFIGMNGVIRAVRPSAEGAPWKKAGIRDLMQSRDLRSFR